MFTLLMITLTLLAFIPLRRAVRAGWISPTAVTAFVFALVLLPVIAFAQDVGPPVEIRSWQDAVRLLLIGIVPFVIWLTKRWFYMEVTGPDGKKELVAPRWFPKGIIPFLAPVIGLLIDWLVTSTSGVDADPLRAASMGALGTWLREFTKPMTRRISRAAKPA